MSVTTLKGQIMGGNRCPGSACIRMLHKPRRRFRVVDVPLAEFARRADFRRSPGVTATAYCETDVADEVETEWNGETYPTLRRRGRSKKGRDNQPTVTVALAVTRDGMSIRSWVLPGDKADVSTVKQIKEDRRAWHLERCVFVGDAGMYAKALGECLGRYIAAVPMARVKEVQ